MGLVNGQLDYIKYGNPTMEQKQFLEERSYLDAVFTLIISNQQSIPPANSSRQTLDELKKLVELSTELNSGRLKDFRERYKQHDHSLVYFFKEGVANIENINVPVAHQLIDNVVNDTIGLLTKLKYHYQRPRPFQLATYYELPLYHHESITIDSPSYPSGHAFMARMLTGVLGHVYPNLFYFMEKVSLDFNNARKFMGVHYPSDVDAGTRIAEIVLKNKSFQKKHNL